MTNKNLETIMLTAFQEDLLNKVKYYVKKQGYYQYNKAYIENQYSEYLTPDQIKNQVDGLITQGVVQKENKLKLIDGKFKTVTILTLA